MTSTVELCNLALSNIGKGRISSLDEASAEARECKLHFSVAVETLLQKHPWRWAMASVALAEVTNTRENRWKHAYQRPVAALKILRVTDEFREDILYPVQPDVKGGSFDYEVVGQVIYTSISPAYLDFICRNKGGDPTVYPPLFAEAVEWALAARLAYPLTKDTRVRSDAYQLAQQAFTQAAASDANEQREVSDFKSELVPNGLVFRDSDPMPRYDE